MASLFKPTYTKRDKCGANTLRKSAKWYGKFRDSAGTLHRVPLCTDKLAAQRMLNEVVIKAERRLAGVADEFDEHNQQPLANHLLLFKAAQIAKGNAVRHVKGTVSRISAICDGCKFRRAADITSGAVTKWLASQRKSGMGISTSNGYLVAIKSFCNWLVKERRIRENRLSHLSRTNADVDVRRERRALPIGEFAKLLSTTVSQPGDYRGLSGRDRAVLYLTAAYSGLRVSELGSLNRRSFMLEGESPTVTVEAAYSKRRRKDSLPVRVDVAKVIAHWMAELPAKRLEDQLWPGTWTERAAEMLKADLDAAGIPYRDEANRVFDFHAMRHQFISNLVLADVHPKVAQQLARHSTITLTMDRYAHVPNQTIVNALQQIPGWENSVGQLVPRLVPAGDAACPPVSSNGHQPLENGEADGNLNSVPAKTLDASSHVMALIDTNRAAGTRTRNQQIMSLLL